MIRLRRFACLALPVAILMGTPAGALGADAPFSMAQVLDYPFESGLVAAERAPVIAWVRNLRGVRNIWLAEAPGFTPRQITNNTADDGQELTGLTFSPDGKRLVWVRGGDHDGNWTAEGNLAPDPASLAESPTVTIWSTSLKGGAPVKEADGDAPALSAHGRLAFIKDGQVWTAPMGEAGKAERLFFDRGHDGYLTWSPDGEALAFVSDRGNHAFIGVFTAKDRPLIYLAASTSADSSPRWSPDGARIAFVRQPAEEGPPLSLMKAAPRPWSIWTADAKTGAGQAVWRSPETLAGSYPEVAGEANLFWAAGDRLAFLAESDNWPHLYSVPAAGGAALLLTPGAFMVEHVSLSRDRRNLIYDANTGVGPDDGERRHLFTTPVDAAAPRALTAGVSIEDQPLAAADETVAFIGAGARQAPSVGLVGLDGAGRRILDDGGTPADFPTAALTVPTSVTFTAADGVSIHGQLFHNGGAGKVQPGVIFVHGGPPRQMMLGWHYMDYYSNAYAVNQYLAAHGFTVLSVNYRLGIGYGRAFQHPENGGPRGASEFQDVVAGARFLAQTAGVDPARIGIWGGSYGGYLTALALARDSDIFKAGVDMHGIHDWWRDYADHDPIGALARFEPADREKAKALAWASSPDADMTHWRSPVLLIQGDDDRNVDFDQTVDAAKRLAAQKTPFEELVIPNEIHGFLLHDSWLRVDTAAVKFLERRLGIVGK